MDTVRLGNVRDGFSLATSHCLVIGSDGTTLGEYGQWLNVELSEAGGDPTAVWRKHRDGPLRFADAEIERICLVAPYGTGTAEFFQIIISRYQYWIERKLFAPAVYAAPRSPESLMEQSGCRGVSLDQCMAFGPPSYRLESIEDLAEVLRLEVQLDDAEKAEHERIVIRTRDMRTGEARSTRHFDEYPQLRTLKLRLARFFADWERSSAGRNGATLTGHFWAMPSTVNSYSAIRYDKRRCRLPDVSKVAFPTSIASIDG